MSKKIKKAYTDNPTAGDDTTTEGYTPFDDGSADELARSDTQLAEVMRVRLGLDDPPAQPGDTTAPVISSFSATIDPDTLVADLVWQVSDNVGVTGWIVKEDDSTLPVSGDSDWSSTERTTFTLSNYNLHTLTARARDAAGNVSIQTIISIQGSQTTGSPPVVDSFTTTDPAANSSIFSFTLDASNATYYKFIYNSNTPPLVGDPGWTAETFASPLTSSATLDDFVDSTVSAYVHDGATVSPALTSFVDVTLAGDTAANNDWLFINNPTIATYNSDDPITFSGSGALVIDGRTAAGTGGQSDASAGTDGFVHLIDINATNYTSIEISNMDLSNSRRCLIFIHDADSIPITTRNNKYGITNRLGEATNQFKKALAYNNCTNCTIKSLGEWFDGPDGGVQLEECGGSDFEMRYPFISGFVSNGSASGESWIESNNIYIGRSGNVTGKIQDVIYYAPDDTYDITRMEDVFNLNNTNGSASTPFQLDRIRIWAGGTGSTATVFQIGDGNYNGYNHIDDATIIDCNGMFQFSSGHHHSVTNVKGYSSEIHPANGSGYAAQVQRQLVDPGKLHDCAMNSNTALWFYDNEDGSPLITSLHVWYPNFGRDLSWVQGWPNHGECVNTCDIGDNVTPDGFFNNDWEYLAWSDGQGKSELWRESWKRFNYAGADGLTPTISYASPWIGDGGSQNFTVANATSTAFGDGANSSDIQTHDVISLGVGGATPYTISSVSAGTNCSVSDNVTGVIWTAGTTDGGAFTYTVTLQDDTGATATGTISGSLASVSATQDYFDQDGTDYIAINPLNYDETYERNGYTFVDESVGPYTPDPYVQIRPYTGDIAIGDVETDSAERIYRVHFDQDGDYDISIMGLAINNFGQYDELWVGWDNVVEATSCKIPTDDSSFRWTNAVGSKTIVTGTKSEYDLHVWVKEGGFAIGAIEVYRTVAGSPKAPDATTSPETQSDRNPY